MQRPSQVLRRNITELQQRECYIFPPVTGRGTGMFPDRELLGQTRVNAILLGCSHPVSFGADGKISTGFKWGAIKTQAVLNRLTKCLRVRSKEKTYVTYIHFSSEILPGNLY